MLINIVTKGIDSKVITNLKSEYPQFNYIQVNEDFSFTSEDVWKLAKRMRLYYVFTIDNSLSYNEIKYEEEVISCQANTRMPTLRHGQRDVDVFILFDDEGILESTVHSLDYYFPQYFWKVWEDKKFNNLYCRGKKAKTWGEIQLADGVAIYPELCSAWWHWCYSVWDVIGYKLDAIIGKIYITEMKAESAVDYGVDKVCCLKARFDEEIREIDYDLAKNIANNRMDWYRKNVIGDSNYAEFTNFSFRAGLLPEFSVEQIEKIINIFNYYILFSDKYRSYYFRKSAGWMFFLGPSSLFIVHNLKIKPELKSKGFKEKQANRIIKYYKDNITTVCIWPNEAALNI